MIALSSLINEPMRLLKKMELRVQISKNNLRKDLDEWSGLEFHMGTERFVADRSQISEVAALPKKTTRIPRTKPWLMGLINIHGQLYPLIDLKMFLGSGRTDLSSLSRILVLKNKDIKVGLIVDNVRGLRTFAKSAFKTDKLEHEMRCEKFLKGKYRSNGSEWALFDLFKLIKSPEFLDFVTN